jgi:16S rRNA (cytidine1402-2'-O)-methyltransferase
MAKLYVVATPIGNLEDLSFRALKILKEVDLILCEDTRITKRLLNRYEIKTPVASYHQHSRLRKINFILKSLEKGKSLALVSDAGTPGISDPGNELISKVIRKFKGKIKIIPIPGASAITAIASIAGFPMQKFLFLGFAPKKKQSKFFREIINSKYPVIFFESPHRITKTLNKLKSFKPDLEVVIAKELTKKFETVLRGKIEDVTRRLEKETIKGEITLVVNPQSKDAEK